MLDFQDNPKEYWCDAIAKEMKNVRTDFDMLDDEEKLPVNYAKMTVDLIFHVKIMV